MKNSLAHVEINVSDIEKSKAFYATILSYLGWEQFDLADNNVCGFKAPDGTDLFLVQTEQEFLGNNFHRKNTGLNHLAFRVENTDAVSRFSDFLDKQNITKLYHQNPKDYSSEYATEQYYAIFFEDPDRIKLEVVFLE
jgi:catechol 2,3-dioxygenase-like lactoylglutathione lyase family enzyme